MMRADLEKAIRPLASKLVDAIVALVVREADGHVARARQLAREALELELDQEDANARAEDAAAQDPPVRALRASRRKAAAASATADRPSDRADRIRARATATPEPGQAKRPCGCAATGRHRSACVASRASAPLAPPHAGRRAVDTSGPAVPAVPVEQPSAHCKTPSKCSVCIGAAARKVSIVGGEVQINGAAVRRAMPGTDVAAPKRGRPSKKTAEAREADARRLADLEEDG